MKFLKSFLLYLLTASASQVLAFAPSSRSGWKTSPRSDEVARAAGVEIADIILPSVAFIGAMAASVYTDKNPDAVSDGIIELAEKATSAQGTEEEEIIVVASTETVVTPAPAASTPAPAAVTPAPATSTPAPAPKPLNDLVQEVGTTIDQKRETDKRLQDKAAAKAAAEPADADAAPASDATTATPVKKRGFVRKSWRVVKKVVAPWRKWENIS